MLGCESMGRKPQTWTAVTTNEIEVQQKLPPCAVIPDQMFDDILLTVPEIREELTYGDVFENKLRFVEWCELTVKRIEAIKRYNKGCHR